MQLAQPPIERLHRDDSARTARAGLTNAYTGLARPEAIIVRLEAEPDLAAARTMPRGATRKQSVWDALEATAVASQSPFLGVADALRGAGLVTDVQSLTSPNALVVTPKFGAAKDVFDAFQIAGVDSIWSNYDGSMMWSPETGVVEPELPGSEPERGDAPTPLAADEPGGTSEQPVNWGLETLGAPRAWERGITGTGMVFGSIDSGVEGVHPAIRENYRGRIGVGQFDDDYSWMDLEAPVTSQPTDPMGHGTHTTGTAVGAGIGVAPDAKWIAVSAVSGATDSFLKALQWMQAPTRVDGTQPDATKAPDVVGMSWGFGEAGQDLFGPSFRHLQAAGIELVKSAGNDGPEPATISTPANYDEVIVVGSVDRTRAAAESSSRGPATRPDGTTIAKPDIAAPGVDIPSSTPGDRYRVASGTSMAQPHVAGAVLLLLQRYPQRTHEQLVQALQSSARDIGPVGWDTATGAGLIDIPAALDAAARITAART